MKLTLKNGNSILCLNKNKESQMKGFEKSNGIPTRKGTMLLLTMKDLYNCNRKNQRYLRKLRLGRDVTIKPAFRDNNRQPFQRITNTVQPANFVHDINKKLKGLHIHQLENILNYVTSMGTPE